MIENVFPLTEYVFPLALASKILDDYFLTLTKEISWQESLICQVIATNFNITALVFH